MFYVYKFFNNLYNSKVGFLFVETGHNWISLLYILTTQTVCCTKIYTKWIIGHNTREIEKVVLPYLQNNFVFILYFFQLQLFTTRDKKEDFSILDHAISRCILSTINTDQLIDWTTNRSRRSHCSTEKIFLTK